MGARGREIVVKEFRADLIAEATIALYDRLLGRAGTASLNRDDDETQSLTGRTGVALSARDGTGVPS
jgi:hypothetical protein